MVTETVKIRFTESGARVVKRNIDDVGSSSSQSVKSVNLLKRALLGLGAAVGTREILRAVDDYTTLQNRLRLVTTSTQNLRGVTDELFKSSRRTRSSFKESAELYTKFALSTKNLDLSQRGLLKIVESVNKAVVLSGADTAAATAGLRQLAQGFQSNRLQGDELRSVLENLPRVTQVLNDSLGTTTAELRKMGEDGLITGQVITKAFQDSEKVLSQEFGTTVPTLGQSLEVLNSSVLLTVGSLSEATGVSGALASAVLVVADNFDVLTRLAITAGLAIGSKFVAGGVVAAVTGIKALTLAIAANPIGAIATAALLGVSALAAFSDTLTLSSGGMATLSDFAQAAFSALSRGFEIVRGVGLSALSSLSSNLPIVGQTLRQVFGDAELDLKTFIGSFVFLLDKIIGGFKGIANAIPLAFSNIPATLEVIFKGIFNKILQLSADFSNAFIDVINGISANFGAPLINKVQALQFELSKPAKDVGQALSDAVTEGFTSETTLSDGLRKIFDDAEVIAAKRIQDSLKTVSSESNGAADGVNNLANATNAAKNKSEDFVKSLEKELATLGKNRFEILKLEAGELKLGEVVFKTIDALEAKTKALDATNSKTQLAAQITQSVATAEEVFAKELDIANKLLNDNLISLETYNRHVNGLQEDLKNTSKTAKSTFLDMSQFAIQAARSIQKSLADNIFNGFDKGLKGMFNGFKNTLKRMIAEVAASGILNVIGTGGSGGSITSTISGLFSQGSSLFSSFSSGVTGALSSGIGSLGNLFGSSALSSFASGLSGSASAGVFGAGGLSFLGGSGTAIGAQGISAAGLGAGFASAVPIVGAALIADQFLKPLFGGAKLGGIAGKVFDNIPVVGTLINGLFGKKEFKQKEQNLSFTAGGDGISDGLLSTKFKAKGGLLSSSSTKRVITDLETGEPTAFSTRKKKFREFTADQSGFAVEIGKLLDDSVSSMSKSISGFVENLGGSADIVDTFSASVNIASEKGKAITEEQIASVLDDIGEKFALHALPIVKDFTLNGETALQTLSRLSEESASLIRLGESFGHTSDIVKTFLKDVSIQARTSFIESSGGVGAVSQSAAILSQLRFDPVKDIEKRRKTLTDELESVGLSFISTKDDLLGLVDSFGELNGINEKQLSTLVRLLPNLVAVNEDLDVLNKSLAEQAEAQRRVVQTINADAEARLKQATDKRADSFEKALNVVQSAFDTLSRSVESRRKKLTTEFNKALKLSRDRIAGVVSAINELQSIQSALGNSRDRLRPMTFREAQAVLQQAINSGGDIASEDLSRALSGLSSISESDFTNSVEFQRAQAKSVSLVDELNKTTDSELILQQRTLAALETSQLNAQNAFDSEIARLDGILAQGQREIDALNGINTTSKGIKAALEALTEALTSANKAKVSSDSPISLAQPKTPVTPGVDFSGVDSRDIGVGPSPISDAQIRDFVRQPGISGLAIYNAAIANGISSTRLALASDLNQTQINDFVKENNLQSFDSGGMVRRTGLAMVHKAERVINPQQNEELVSTLREVADELVKSRIINEKIAANSDITARGIEDVASGAVVLLTEQAE